MTTPISNNSSINNITPSTSTSTSNTIGTPDARTANALQNQLNATAATSPVASAGTPPVAGKGISAEDMKIFMDEMNKFCVNQGIFTTPKATRD